MARLWRTVLVVYASLAGGPAPLREDPSGTVLGLAVVAFSANCGGSLPTDEKLSPMPKHVSGIEVTVEPVVFVGEGPGVFGGAGGPSWMRWRIAS